MIDMETLEYMPSDEQVTEWEQCTTTSFSLPLATGSNDTVGISCPKCSKITTVPWITVPTLRSPDDTSGTGYAQNDFTTACISCGFIINHDALRVFKLVQDVAEITSSENAALA
jgi:hypothetical protein